MEISAQYLWPLLGVLLGWLLSALSSGWKLRAERKILMGRLLTRLIDIHGDLQTLIKTSENLKSIPGGWERYETLRQGVYARHFLESSIKANDFPDLASSLSGFLPLEAARLQTLFGTLLKSKTLKLDAASTDPSTYVRLLSMHEVGLTHCDKELKRVIRAIACRHGAFTRVKLWWHHRKLGKTRKANAEFLNQFAKETIDSIGSGS